MSLGLNGYLNASLWKPGLLGGHGLEPLAAVRYYAGILFGAQRRSRFQEQHVSRSVR